MGRQKAKLIFLGLLIVALGLSVWVKRNESQAPSIVSSEPSSTTLEKPQISPVPTSERQGAKTTAKEIPALTEAQAQFQKLTEKAKLEIPTQQDLQNLSPQQTHHTPEVMQRAALNLGQIAQAMADDKTLIPAGLKFYRECAEKIGSPNSIRAACFASHEEILKKDPSLGESLEKDTKVSDSVKRLAKTL